MDEELSKYVGEFKINSNDTLFNEEDGYNLMKFKVVENQLYALLFGGVEFEIFPHAENVFIFDDYENIKFAFVQNENSQITGMQLFNNSVYTDWIKWN